MPEGDTVYRAAQRLQAALAGRVLRLSDFRVPRLATSDLAGRTVEKVVPRGKHLFFHISGGLRLHTHFKMDGSWHLYRHGERWRGQPEWQARVVLQTDDWVAVGFRLPVLELLTPEGEQRIAAGLGPDPLSSTWDPEEAIVRFVRDPTRSVSDVLLDQAVMAGPGNVYRCEICFLRGLNPWTRVADIAQPEKVIDLVKRLFDANRDGARRVTTGDARRGRELWVYGRGGKACRRCGTPIQRRQGTPMPDGERVAFWCPHCQPSSRQGDRDSSKR